MRLDYLEAVQVAISSIYQGLPVVCSKEEYHGGLRGEIQDQAGKWIEQGDGLRASIALQEVKRLDAKLGFSVFTGRSQ